MLVAEAPENYNCQQCVLSGKKNHARGRECLLERDYAKNPIPYAFKVRNSPLKKGTVKSEDGLYKAITIALEVHRTDDASIALRRIGKGICPKSFPITRQSYYFLELFSLTHGGEAGTELTNLPLSGGVLEQPAIFFNACNIIGSVRSRYLRDKLGEHKQSNNQNKSIQQADTGRGGLGQAGRFSQGSNQ